MGVRGERGLGEGVFRVCEGEGADEEGGRGGKRRGKAGEFAPF